MGMEFVVEPYLPQRDREALTGLSGARLPGEPVVERAIHSGLPMRQVVVRDNGELIAYADFGDVAVVNDADTMHVWIIVHPDWSRLGVGKLLLDRAIEYAKSNGRSSLVTAVDRTDRVAERWLLKHCFQQSGDLDIRRRRPRSSTGASPSALVEVIPSPMAGLDSAFLEIAANGMSNRPLPDGTRVVVSPEDIRSWYLGPDSDGQVYRITIDGKFSAFASVQSAQSAGYSVEPIWATNADRDLLDALLREIVQDADQSKRELVIGFSPLGEAALDDAISDHGFESVGGRMTWRRAL